MNSMVSARGPHRCLWVILALTSHASDIVTAAAFSGVEITGGVTAQWQAAEIGGQPSGQQPGRRAKDGMQ